MMRCPQGKTGAFFYSVVMGIGIACAVIMLFILFLQWIAGAQASETQRERDQEIWSDYQRGVPYDFTYYPNVEVEVELTPNERLRCNACVLEEYHRSTTEQRLKEFRTTVDKYYGDN